MRQQGKPRARYGPTNGVGWLTQERQASSTGRPVPRWSARRMRGLVFSFAFFLAYSLAPGQHAAAASGSASYTSGEPGSWTCYIDWANYNKPGYIEVITAEDHSCGRVRAGAYYYTPAGIWATSFDSWTGTYSRLVRDAQFGGTSYHRADWNTTGAYGYINRSF